MVTSEKYWVSCARARFGATGHFGSVACKIGGTNLSEFHILLFFPVLNARIRATRLFYNFSVALDRVQLLEKSYNLFAFYSPRGKAITFYCHFGHLL